MVSFGQIVRSLGDLLAYILVCILVFTPCMFLFNGIIATWRDADYISSLDEEKQEIAFLAISRGQENGGHLATTIDGRYGVGLVKGASTATIMREIFLGYNWLYVECAKFMACILLALLTPSALKKCAK